MLNDSQASPLGGWHRWHPSNILQCISPLQPLCSKYLEQLAQDWSLSRVYELTFCYNSITYNPAAVFFFSIFSSGRLCLIIQASSLVPPIQRLVWWIRNGEEPQELRGNKGAGGNRYCCFTTKALTEFKFPKHPRWTTLTHNCLKPLSKNDILSQIWRDLEMLRYLTLFVKMFNLTVPFSTRHRYKNFFKKSFLQAIYTNSKNTSFTKATLSWAPEHFWLL